MFAVGALVRMGEIGFQAEVASVSPRFHLFHFTHDRFDHIFGTTRSVAKKDGPIRNLTFLVALFKFSTWACGKPAVNTAQ